MELKSDINCLNNKIFLFCHKWSVWRVRSGAESHLIAHMFSPLPPGGHVKASAFSADRRFTCPSVKHRRSLALPGVAEPECACAFPDILSAHVYITLTNYRRGLQMKCEQTQYLRYLTPNQQWQRWQQCDVLSHVINKRSVTPERSSSEV